jgi:hypothetical protein
MVMTAETIAPAVHNQTQYLLVWVCRVLTIEHRFEMSKDTVSIEIFNVIFS